MSFLHFLHEFLLQLMRMERRIDPFFRPALDAVLREPLAELTQALRNALRKPEDLALAEERPFEDEQTLLERIVTDMRGFQRDYYRPGGFERAGNTKTHGVVRGSFIIHEGLPSHLRHGVFAEPKTYPAWVRFSGPGPASPADIDDVGVLSIGIKLMGVTGPKLMDDEKFTQDFTGISTPTFTTPDVRENTKLQAAIRRGLPLFYFIGLPDSHFLDGLMQGLWARTQSSPLETGYWSCVPYLLGPGQAMQYQIRPCSNSRTKVPNLPSRPPDNYLREAMAKTLAVADVDFDFFIQMQTDPRRMPIEDAGVRWPEKLSPPHLVATLRLPRQHFDSPAQLAFARRLSYNPWHALPEHRPLGNQNRVRGQIYRELSRFRQIMDATPHFEPNGDETFPPTPTSEP